jgi:anaerobic selenocysteine-containing dehydrogenase
MSEVRQVKGCCPLDCQDSCSWIAHVDDGRVTRIEGASDHPFTRGALCAKTNDYQARIYAPDRLLHPLRRIGTKGSGQFERITWNEALDTITSKFTAIIDEDGPEALMPLNYLGSMGVVQHHSLMRLFHSLGTTRFHGNVCGAAGAELYDEGHPLGFDPETIADSRFILLIGANLLSTAHHVWHFLSEARKHHGTRIVCIDPQETRTAKACDEHIAIRPGSDGAFAAGIAHVMFEEGLADLEFAERVASDSGKFQEQVQAWNPDRVASVCGIEADTVIRIAKEFGNARPATVHCGIAPQQSVHGEDLLRSLSALAIVGGHWRSSGGGLFVESGPVFNEKQAGRRDLLEGKPRNLDMARMGQYLTDENLAPPIKGLMVWGMNPAVTLPDVGRFRQGLEREDLFTVVLEHFMTDTARYADIVLPSTTQLEHLDVQGSWGHHYISINNPAIEPVGETKSHGEVMRLLSKRLGLTHPALQESDEEIAASVLPSGVDLKSLNEKGWHKSSPKHPTFEGVQSRLKLCGGIHEPVEADKPGSLQLLTPKSHYFLNSSFGNMPRQRKAMKCPTLDMNPQDAETRGLEDGQQVIVKNKRGEFRVLLHVTDAIRPGVLSLPGKWWGMPEETGAVANLLTPSSWSRGGQPAYNETYVTVVDAG